MCSRLWLSTNSSQIPNKGSPPFTEFLLRLILPSKGCMCVLSRKGKGIVNCEGSSMYMKLGNQCSILQKHWGYHSLSSCCSYRPTTKAARINSWVSKWKNIIPENHNSTPNWNQLNYWFQKNIFLSAFFFSVFSNLVSDRILPHVTLKRINHFIFRAKSKKTKKDFKQFLHIGPHSFEVLQRALFMM